MLNAGDLTGSNALFRRLLSIQNMPRPACTASDTSSSRPATYAPPRNPSRNASGSTRSTLTPSSSWGSSQNARDHPRRHPSGTSRRYPSTPAQGAHSRLRALAAPNGLTPSQAGALEHGSPEEDVPDNVDDYGVYEFLKRDNLIVLRQAIAIIDDLAIEARPSFIAYAGVYLRRILIALVIGLAIFRQYFVFVGPVLLLVFYLYVLTVRIRLHRGRLQIERGLFGRKLKNYDIWRIRNIDLDRRLLNRISGDGMPLRPQTLLKRRPDPARTTREHGTRHRTRSRPASYRSTAKAPQSGVPAPGQFRVSEGNHSIGSVKAN